MHYELSKTEYVSGSLGGRSLTEPKHFASLSVTGVGEVRRQSAKSEPDTL